MESRIDPITLEVVRNKLEDIAEEMELTLLRTSHSPIVKEALDASAALFDANAQQIAQATAAPIHLGMIIPAVRRLLELFPAETMKDGDAFVLNDPFDGGTHLPDLVVTVPVRVDGETIALATTITHHQEIGGRSPGSTPMNATELLQEGLVIPPLKLYDAGEPNETLLAMIARNVRVPETVLGDLRGQIAACELGRRRIVQLASRYGKAQLMVCAKELLDRAELLTRAELLQIPDAAYEFTDYLDNDGVDLKKRVRIHARVSITGSDFEVDLRGSNPQVAGPINCVPASTISAVYYVLKVLVGPSIPNNAGCYRPVRLVLPEASVVNARAPAAVNGRAVVVRRLVDCMLGALAPAFQDRIPAASSGHPLVLTMGGRNPDTGDPYVTTEAGTGGMGARPGKDGLEAIQTDTSNAQNVPVEALEMESPILVNYYRLRADSGGPGRFRGGLGLEKSIQVTKGSMHVSHRGERHYTAPWGLAGGGAGAMSRSELHDLDGGVQVIPSKLDFDLVPGQTLRLWTAGGGGYGDPLERDEQAVLDDVRNGKVSLEAAKRNYGVVVSDGFLDVEATAKERRRSREARGRITWFYDRGPLGLEQVSGQEP